MFLIVTESFSIFAVDRTACDSIQSPRFVGAKNASMGVGAVGIKPRREGSLDWFTCDRFAQPLNGVNRIMLARKKQRPFATRRGERFDLLPNRDCEERKFMTNN